MIKTKKERSLDKLPQKYKGITGKIAQLLVKPNMII